MWMSWNASSARLLNNTRPHLFTRIMCHFCLPFLLIPICLSRRSKEQLLPELTSTHLCCFALPRVLTLYFFWETCRIVLSEHLPFLRSGSKKDNYLHVPMILATVRGSVILCHRDDLMLFLNDFKVHKWNQQKNGHICTTALKIRMLFEWLLLWVTASNPFPPP